MNSRLPWAPVPAEAPLVTAMVANLEPAGLLILLQPVVEGRPVKWRSLFISKRQLIMAESPVGVALLAISTPLSVGCVWPVRRAGGGAVDRRHPVAGNSSQWSQIAGWWLTSHSSSQPSWSNHSVVPAGAACSPTGGGSGIDQKKLLWLGTFSIPCVADSQATHLSTPRGPPAALTMRLARQRLAPADDVLGTLSRRNDGYASI